MQPLLSVENLSVRYGKVEAVHEVSLRLDAGQIVTVVGPNGAGKTTLMAAIMGLLPADGRIMIDGVDQHGIPVEERVANGVSLVPEKRELFAEMTVQDNLELGALTRSRRGERGLDAGARGRLRHLPAAQGTAPPAGRHPVGRRAADAGAEPGA